MAAWFAGVGDVHTGLGCVHLAPSPLTGWPDTKNCTRQTGKNSWKSGFIVSPQRGRPRLGLATSHCFQSHLFTPLRWGTSLMSPATLILWAMPRPVPLLPGRSSGNNNAPPHNVDVCKFCRRALTLMNFFQFQIVGNRLLPCPWTFLGSRHHVQTGQGSRHGECARPQSFTPLHLLV